MEHLSVQCFEFFGDGRDYVVCVLVVISGGNVAIECHRMKSAIVGVSPIHYCPPTPPNNRMQATARRLVVVFHKVLCSPSPDPSRWAE